MTTRCLAFLPILLLLVSRASTLTFRMAWLAPTTRYNDLAAASSVGGLGLAIDDVTNSGVHDFQVRWEDSDCKSNVSLARIYDVIIRDNWKPDVIIGPPCSAAMGFIAELSGFRNLAIIGWQSDNTKFAEKKVYNTLIQVLPPINTLGSGLMYTLKKFKWKTVFLLSSKGDPYAQIGGAIDTAITEAKPDGYQLTRWVADEDLNPTSTRIESIYRTLKKEARIVILVVPRTELRTWMLAAEANGMTDGTYVFIYINGELPTPSVLKDLTSSTIWKTGSDDGRAETAFKHLLIFTSRNNNNDANFNSEADTAAKSWAPRFGLSASAESDNYAPFLHDAVQIYTTLASEASAAGASHTDGESLRNRARNRLFTGPEYVTDPILLDDNADRWPDFGLYDLAEDGSFTLAQLTKSTIANWVVNTNIEDIKPVVWGDGSSGTDNAPPDIPTCGFENEKCPDLVLYIVPPVVCVVLIIIAVAAFLAYRRVQFEQSIKDMVWKLERDELKTNKKKDHLSIMMAGSKASGMVHSRTSALGSRAGALQSQHSIGKKSATASAVSGAVDDKSQIFVNVAQYKGGTVAIKQVRKSKIKMDRDLLVEMRNMTNMKHNNIATLVGATTEMPEIYEVWEYCSKGSLQDVIWNENINLDDMFKFSISIDMFKGLKYLHDSPLKVHGKLKSSNCVIDGRWMCKLTDYGLYHFRAGSSEDPEMSDFSKQSRLFWTAPEILRKMQDGVPAPTSQEADIYAGAVILKEIFARNAPYTECEDDFEPEEIIDNVKAIPEGLRSPFRPSFSETKGKAPDKLLDTITAGWSEKPSDRPSVSHMIKDIQKVNPNKSANVMDNMIRMMERYTNHLEEVVGERTQQVEEEKKKSEMLLYRMLPRPIAEDLKRGKSVEAESFDSVSLYFSDIVSFTSLSAQSTPMQVVSLLNGLYTIFDSAIAEHDVYKVETIGDAYMLASGLPRRNGDNHAVEIANCAMDLLSGIMNFKVSHMPDDYVLRLRIGLHTGPAVAGVVGLAMPRYCLFGNTVNVATSMESGGMPMRIQMSQFTYDILKKFTGYTIAARNDPLDVKGLGKINTYWLVAREGYTKPLPDYYELSATDNPKPTTFPVSKGRTFRSSITDGAHPEIDIDKIDRKPETDQKVPEHMDEDRVSDDFKETVDSIEPDPESRNEQEGKKDSDSRLEADTKADPDDNKEAEESWADPGKAAPLKAALEAPRPTTASSIRARLSISKPSNLPDLVLEDTNVGEEDA